MSTATERAQSLAEFRDHAAETLDRVNRTGAAEVITVNGEARGVLLSPAVYDTLAREVQLSRDVAVIRRSMAQYEAGQDQSVQEVSAELRAHLLSMKATRSEGSGK